MSKDPVNTAGEAFGQGAAFVVENIVVSRVFANIFKTTTIGGKSFETLYRVQSGGSKIRFVIKGNEIAIAGEDMLFVNINQEERAMQFSSEKRGDESNITQIPKSKNLLLKN